MDGRIVLEGGVELVERLEREGYDQIRQEFGATEAGALARSDGSA
jgi:Fe-S cluster assembly ATPase SufC